MKPLFNLLLIFQLLCSCLLAGNLELIEIASITTESGRDIDYILAENEKNSLLVTVTTFNNHSNIAFYDSNFQAVENIFLPGTGFSRLRSFILNDLLYISLDRLYRIDLATYNVDTLKLKERYYHSLDYYISNRDTIIIGSCAEKVQLYSLPDLDLIQEIIRTEHRQLDLPLATDDLLIFQNRDNELAVYGQEQKMIINKFNSGEQPAYFLGIKIGNFDDTISWYRTIKDNERQIMYYATFSGCLFVVDPISGDTLKYRSRFMGDDNNAGLLTSFEVIDMDLNGIPDLVGASVDHNIYCISGSDLALMWSSFTGGENQLPLSFGDINGDTIPEVFGINDDMVITVLNGVDGEVLLQKKLYQPGFQSSAGLADLNLDNSLELLVTHGSRTLKIYKLNGVYVEKNKILWVPKI